MNKINPIWYFILGAGVLYFVYKKGVNSKELLLPTDLGCAPTDTKKIQYAAQKLRTLFGKYLGWYSSSFETQLINCFKELKNDCDVKALYGMLGEVDGFGTSNGDLFYQISRLTDSTKDKIKPYLFTYAKEV